MDSKIDSNVKSVRDDNISNNINTEEKKRKNNSLNENNNQDNNDKVEKNNKPENQKNNKNSKKQNKKPQLNIDENGMILLPVPTSVDTNKDHYQRVNYLNQASLVLDNLSIANNGWLARLYNKNSDKIMKKSRISLSPNIKMFKCKKCFVNLQVGKNLEIKLTDNIRVGKHKKGVHSDNKLPKQNNLSENLKSHVIAYRCSHCGYKVKNFYIGKNNQYVSFHDKNLIKMTKADNPLSTTDAEVPNNNDGL